MKLSKINKDKKIEIYKLFLYEILTFYFKFKILIILYLDL